MFVIHLDSGRSVGKSVKSHAYSTPASGTVLVYRETKLRTKDLNVLFIFGSMSAIVFIIHTKFSIVV